MIQSLAIHLRYRNSLATGRLESDVSDASVLDSHDNRPVLQHRKMNPIARLEIRRRAHLFGNSGLTLAGYGCCGHLQNSVLTISNIVSAEVRLRPGERSVRRRTPLLSMRDRVESVPCGRSGWG